MAGKPKEPKNDVVVQPQAFASMVLHALNHKYETVHGILLGQCSQTTTTVTDAVPVCHGAPTRSLVETAIGLIQANKKKSDGDESGVVVVVGWYTAPALLEDTKPGPVALRMAANLETPEVHSTLIVIQNPGLVACLKGEGKAEDVLQAYGKDFGKQFLDPIKTLLQNPADALGVVKRAIDKGIVVGDLVDHFDGDADTAWYPNTALVKLL
jgi:hypothetical protein